MTVFVVWDALHEEVKCVCAEETDAQEYCRVMNAPRITQGNNAYLFEYGEFVVNTRESIYSDEPIIGSS